MKFAMESGETPTKRVKLLGKDETTTAVIATSLESEYIPKLQLMSNCGIKEEISDTTNVENGEMQESEDVKCENYSDCARNAVDDEVSNAVISTSLPLQNGERAATDMKIEPDSVLPPMDDGTREEYERLILKIQKLEHKKADLLESSATRAQFRLSFLEDSDSDIELYTGFPNHTVLMTFYHFIEPGAQGENLVACAPRGTLSNGKTRLSSLSLDNEFLLTMMKLRLGLYNQDLACRFGINSRSVVSIFESWTNLMHRKLQPIVLWPPRSLVDEYMPLSFKENFPHTRVILDFVELKVTDVNADDDFNLVSRAQYKGMVAVLPSGHIALISSLYPLSKMDKFIAKSSELMNQSFDAGDTIMADRSARIHEFLNLKLAIPPFFESDDKFKPQEARSMEALHNDIIKALDRVRSFLIFDRVLPSSSVAKIWDICCRLVNCQMPVMVKKDHIDGVGDVDDINIDNNNDVLEPSACMEN